MLMYQYDKEAAAVFRIFGGKLLQSYELMDNLAECLGVVVVPLFLLLVEQDPCIGYLLLR